MNKVKQIINNLATKIGMDEIFEEPFNPYCEICTSCSEVGCCPPTLCTQEEGCKYPETNLTDLKYNYTSYHRLLEYLYEYEEKYKEVIAELDKITDEEYDKWYSK